MSVLYVAGHDNMTDAKALAKLSELEGQAEGLSTTIRGHERSIEECRKQMAEIEKLAKPFREALLRRLGVK